MTERSTTASASASAAPVTRRLGGAGGRFLRNGMTLISIGFLVVLVLVAVFGPLFLRDPNASDLTMRLVPPGPDALLGTDHLGRDLMARVVEGARVSILVSLVVTAASFVVAGIIGTISGYAGGWVDEALARFFDVLITFPSLLLGVIVVVAIGPSLQAVIIALAIANIPLYARQFRAGTIGIKHREYVQAVVASGMPTHLVLLRHVVPNILAPIIVIAAGSIGRISLAEASLSYLGAGIPLPNASWGNMVAEGQRFIQTAPWVAVVPGVVLTLYTIALSFIGDALRDGFDVRDTEVAKAGG
jgi:peptide/nickel transport system permease protein